MLLSWNFKTAYPWSTVYEGDDEAAAAEAAAAEAAAAEAAAAAAAAAAEAKKGEEKKTFTQEQVNKMLADDRRKHQKQVEAQVKELENLRKSKSLSDKDRETLTHQIQSLSDSLLTKEELARKNEEKLKGDHKRQLEDVSKERDDWRNRFHHSTITRSITDEAHAAEAYSPQQIVALLQGQTRLVEVTDADGNVVPGQFIAKVKMSDTDQEGKPVTLDLTVKEALKRMQDRTDDFGNLFKSGVSGGLGDSKNRAGGKEVDPSKMTATQFREWRKKRGW